MGYRNLLDCVRDLEAAKELVRIDEPIDPHLEMAEIQRRVFRAGGPGPALHPPQGLPLPHAGKPLWHDASGCATCSATRSTASSGW